MRELYRKESPLNSFLGMGGGASRFIMGMHSGIDYWIAEFGSSTLQDRGRKVKVDNAGNVYMGGYSNTYNSSNGNKVHTGFIVKYDKTGAIQWQRTLSQPGITSGGVYLFDISIDSSGNVYVCGTDEVRRNFVAKYNNSGVIQWQRTMNGNALGDYYGNELYGIGTDSSGNVYAAGKARNMAVNSTILIKYNSSGTLQFQRSVGVNWRHQIRDAAIDSSGNFYIVGYGGNRANGSSFDGIFVAKVNSSGVVQWEQTLGGDTNTTNTETGEGITVDSSGNIYVIGYGYTGTVASRRMIIAKYNNSGVIQWQRTLNGTSFGEIGEDVAVDSSGNVYVCGFFDTNGTSVSRGNDAIIAKYNSSGTLQWQRTLANSQYGKIDEAYGITVDNKGTVYVTGMTETNVVSVFDVKSLAFIAKLPPDGSLTGTYGRWTYAASSFTSATSTYATASRTMTSTALSLNAATGAMTDSAGSFSSSTITL